MVTKEFVLSSIWRQLLDGANPGAKRRRIERARESLKPRSIEIHSVTPRPSAAEPRFYRVAFIFLDPPGPYSLQFYEAAAGDNPSLERFVPGYKARYYESRDEALVRVMETEDGAILWPR